MFNPNLKLSNYLLSKWVKSHYDAINISHMANFCKIDKSNLQKYLQGYLKKDSHKIPEKHLNSIEQYFYFMQYNFCTHDNIDIFKIANKEFSICQLCGNAVKVNFKDYK